MEPGHNHDESDFDYEHKFTCPACYAIALGWIPMENGTYEYE